MTNRSEPWLKGRISGSRLDFVSNPNSTVYQVLTVSGTGLSDFHKLFYDLFHISKKGVLLLFLF